MSFELSGSDPEFTTAVSEVKGASVVGGGWRRSGFCITSTYREGCGVVGASLILSVSLSGEVGFGATVKKEGS